MRLLSILFLICAVLLGVSFAILNAGFVTVHYYVGTARLPLVLVILIAFVLGLGIGWLVSSFKILGLKMALKRQNH